MSNTISAVLPSIYAGLDVVSREMIGIIPAAQRDASMEQAAVGQTVTVPVVPAATGGNITPGPTPPDDGDVTIGSMPVTITKSKYSPVRWNGEEQKALGPLGQVYNKILADQFAQSMRWLANQIEVDGMTAAMLNASRAYGAAATTPFGTAGDLTDFAGTNRILDENGAPMSDRRLIVGSAARFNLEGKQSVLFKVNESGDAGALLNRRILPEVQGLTIGISAGAQKHTKGTGTSYQSNHSAGYNVGDTVIALDTGSGTVVAGDGVTFAGDTNQYIVQTALAAGSLTLAAPGLRQTLADNVAMTVLGTFTANVAFTPNALVLAARAPARPAGGDSADDVTMVQDPVSGLAFEIALYREYRRIRYEVALAWGWGVVKREHIALLLG